MSAAAYAVAALELGMIVAGLVLLWRELLSPGARLERGFPPLAAWNAPIHNFLLFLLSVFLGTMMTAMAGGILSRQLPLGGDALTIFNGAAAQLGMIAGVAAYHFRVERLQLDTPTRPVRVVHSGIATFLLSLPILTVTSLAWRAFLEVFGLPAQQQDLIRMFAHADSPGLLLTMTMLAVVVAPVAEELVFRGGLFRYLRTRTSRSVALVAPALFFAVLHVSNWRTLDGFASVGPLTVLAIVYSIAYERTGRIGTAIVAHGLFNLNTVLLIVTGIGV